MADIVYAVWWSILLTKKARIFRTLFRNKRIIATITNDLSHQERELDRLINMAGLYVYASSKQKDTLLNKGISPNAMFFNPFYVDEGIFKDLFISRRALAERLGIDFDAIRDKYLVGSFQRDSLGTDLSKQKWQKNPDGLIEIISRLDRAAFVLVLAGPRRHYLVNRCKNESIPYIFIGNRETIDKNIDDVFENNLDERTMALLYNLIDLYIVSSLSEGGPKAIPEAVLTHTPVISSDVGFAKDLLCEKSIYTTNEDAGHKLDLLKHNQDYKTGMIEENLQKTGIYYGFDLYKSRVKQIIDAAFSM